VVSILAISSTDIYHPPRSNKSNCDLLIQDKPIVMIRLENLTTFAINQMATKHVSCARFYALRIYSTGFRTITVKVCIRVYACVRM